MRTVRLSGSLSDRIVSTASAVHAAGAARVGELLRPGPVLIRLAVRGFGVELPPDPPPPWD